VTPKPGLQAGFQTGTVIIGAANCAPVTITLNFTVSARDTSRDLPNWDGAGILITKFNVNPIIGGNLEIFMEFACETVFVPGELQLFVYDDLALPPTFIVPFSTFDLAKPIYYPCANHLINDLLSLAFYSMFLTAHFSELENKRYTLPPTKNLTSSLKPTPPTTNTPPPTTSPSRG